MNGDDLPLVINNDPEQIGINSQDDDLTSSQRSYDPDAPRIKVATSFVDEADEFGYNSRESRDSRESNDKTFARMVQFSFNGVQDQE